MADAVDAGVLLNQRPALEPRLDLIPRDSCTQQLAASDDAVGAIGDSSDSSLRRPGLSGH
jgi:hypothetical protein